MVVVGGQRCAICVTFGFQCRWESGAGGVEAQEAGDAGEHVEDYNGGACDAVDAALAQI